MSEENPSTDRVVESHRELLAAEQRISACPDRTSVLAESARQAARLVGAAVSLVFLRNDAGDLTVVASEGDEALCAAALALPCNPPARTTIPAPGVERELCACTWVPFPGPGETDGVLAAYHRTGREPSALDELLLSALAEHARLVLRNLVLSDESRESAEQTRSAERREVARGQLLERVLRQMPVAVVIAEAPSGRVLLTSGAVRTLWRGEVDPPSCLGEYDRFTLLHLDGTPYAPEENPLVRAIVNGELVTEEEHSIVTRDGEISRVLCSAVPVRDDAGKIVAGVLTSADVTERTRTGDAIRDSEERLRLLVHDVKDYAIYMLDPTGRVASWNLGAERITGYRADEILGRHHTVFFLQEDVLVGKPEHPLKVAAEKGRAEAEGWLLRKDGSRFWGRDTLTAMRDPQGRLRGFSLVLQDATERRLIEEALLESNRRTASILESISDAFCAVDCELRFTFVNPEAERLLAKTRSDLVGRTMLEGLPELASTRFHSDTTRAMNQHETLAFEEYYASLQKWLEVRVYPSDVGLSIYFRDITGRRRWELAQRLLADAGRRVAESLDYAATLETVANVGVPELADGCVVLVPEENGSATFQFAIAHPDAALKATWSEYLEHEGPRAAPAEGYRVGLRRVLETGVSELVPEVTGEWLLAAARDPQHLELLQRSAMLSYMAVPLRARGRTLGVLAFVSHTAERRYGSADLRLAEEVGRIAAFAVDNARLYREAQSAIQAREDVVSIASHDIKAPLQTMLLRVQMLLRAARPAVALGTMPPGLIEGLEAIETQVDRLARLTDVLLDISRIASGRLELRPDDVDAIDIVREAAAQLAEQAAKTGSRIDLSFDGPVLGRWDRTRFEQIVTNLLSNAIRYGRGEPIDVRLDADERTVRLRIRDHGPGIAEEKRELVFQRFQRAGKVEPGSFGLGLWITRQIVERFGGRIEVGDAEGGGAVFSVELPRSLPTTAFRREAHDKAA